jgi:hypothetical protein
MAAELEYRKVAKLAAPRARQVVDMRLKAEAFKPADGYLD